MILYLHRQLKLFTNSVIKKLWNFLLYGSVFIAVCAVALSMETSLLLDLPFNSFGFYCFVFGATVVQYNLHYISKTTAVAGSTRLEWTRNNQYLHYWLLIAGIVLLIYSLTTFHLRHFSILLCLGAIATVYSFPVLPLTKKKRIKEFGFLKILTLSLLWTLVTVWFPANSQTFDPVLYWFVFFKRLIFMFVLCLLFDMRDVKIDRQHNIRTLPVKFGIKSAYKIAYYSLFVFIILTILQFYYFRQIGVLVAMLLSSFATFYVIACTKKNNSDDTYLAGIDGMMILQAILVYVFTLNL